MTSIFRLIDPKFNPPPTVENPGVRPVQTKQVDMQVVNRELRELAKSGIVRLPGDSSGPQA